MNSPMVTSITPHLRTLEAPSELRQLQGWLIWRHEQFPGESKPRKVPYYVEGGKRHGRQGTSEDRSKLTTFAAARDAAARRGFDGVGFAPMADFNITALDFDKCVDADGSLPPEVAAIVEKTYAEYSPSGNGIRAFVRGNLGNHKSFASDDVPFTFEVFGSNGFCTLTGNALPITQRLGLQDHIETVWDDVTDLCHKRFGSRMGDKEPSDDDDPFEGYAPRLGLGADEVHDYVSDLDPDIGRHEWIRVGMAIHHETDGDGFDIWDEWSSGSSKYPGRESLKNQWASFDRRDSNRAPVTFASVKMMSKDARQAKGQEPRGVDIARIAETSRQDPEHPDVYTTPQFFEGKYTIHGAGTFASRPPPKWIIKHVLPEADLGVLYGASGAGKSFVALDMGLSIARGVPWRGKKVKQGRVLLIAAEGGGGMSMRLRAYAQHHQVDLRSVPLGIIHATPNLLSEEDVGELVKAIMSAGSGDLIIIDTFAQVTAGANENSGEDMGNAIRNARAIREATGSMVLVVHHSGKDASKGARGWSGIRAAADVEFEVVRPEEGSTRLLRVSKQKDGQDDLQWGFELESVMVGLDEDDEEMTSLVVLEADVPVPADEDPEPEIEDNPFDRRVGAWEQVLSRGLSDDGLALAPLKQIAAELLAVADDDGDDPADVEGAMGLGVDGLLRGYDPPLEILHGLVKSS